MLQHMVPASALKTEALRKELDHLGKQWDELHKSDEELGGGSPGEWMWERMGEIEHELKRREQTRK